MIHFQEKSSHPFTSVGTTTGQRTVKVVIFVVLVTSLKSLKLEKMYLFFSFILDSFCSLFGTFQMFGTPSISIGKSLEISQCSRKSLKSQQGFQVLLSKSNHFSKPINVQ